MAGESHPKARDGLLTSDHSKRGRRYLIILDRMTNKPTLLEPWEHAILILCDGTRDATQIAKLLEKGVEGEPIDLRVVQRCLKYFEREVLIEPMGLRSKPPSQEFESPGPRTLANLQQAYREWHKDPVRTGHILSGLFAPPFVDPAGGFFRAGLDPTVALPDEEDGERKGTVQVGSMLVLADADSLLKKGPPPAAATIPSSPPPRRGEPETLIGPLAENSGPRTGGAAMISADDFEPDQDVAELLKAVDHDFQEVETREARERANSKRHGKKPHVPPPIGKAIGGEARLPEARDRKKPTAKVLMTVEPDAALVQKLENADVRGLPGHRSIPMSESALRPTMVGAPPQEGTKEHAPVLLVPPRSDTPADAKLEDLETERPTRAGPGSKAGGSISIAREETIPFDPDVEQTLRLPAAMVLGEELASAALIFDVGSSDEATEGNLGPLSLGDLGGDPKKLEKNAKTDKREKKKGVHDENTEPRYRQKGPKTRGGSPTSSMRAAKPSPFDDSNPSHELNLPARAREVFDRLRKAGLKARTQSGDDERTSRGSDPKVPRRRRNEEDARRFDEAIKSLSAGELEVALKHFRRLRDKMPQSKRLAAFIEAIEAVRTGAEEDRDPDTLKKPAQRHGSTQRILEEFEGLLEEAVAYGRCPACFSMVAKNFTSCFACGFALESSSE